MSALVLPSVLRQQPQQAFSIDQSNPLTTGLIAVFIGSQAYDPVSGKPFVNTSANNRTIGPMGYGVDGRIGQAKVYPGGRSISTGSMFVVVSTTDPTTEQIVAEIGPDGSFTDGVRGLRFVNGKFSAYVRNFFEVSTANTFGINKPIPVGVTYAGSSTSIYVNGRLEATGTAANTTSNADTFNLGGITNQTSYNVRGSIPVACAWSRVLSAAEMASLAENPWQLFKAPARRLWVASAASNAYTMPAALGTYNLTGNATVLRVARKMPALSGAYALTGSAAALRLAHRMVAAQGSYLITGQAASLIKGTAPRALQVSSGVYAITGAVISFKVARRLPASPGFYIIMGVATGAPVSGAVPRSYAATIMRFTFTNRSAQLGPASINRTVSFP